MDLVTFHFWTWVLFPGNILFLHMWYFVFFPPPRVEWCIAVDSLSSCGDPNACVTTLRFSSIDSSPLQLICFFWEVTFSCSVCVSGCVSAVHAHLCMYCINTSSFSSCRYIAILWSYILVHIVLITTTSILGVLSRSQNPWHLWHLVEGVLDGRTCPQTFFSAQQRQSINDRSSSGKKGFKVLL